jgi:tRNA A-37 threonylcarbamoyl transferase component Bud32
MSYTKIIPFASAKWKFLAKDIELEIEFQNIAASYGFAPNILEYTKYPDRYEIVMELIDAPCLAAEYSDDPKKIPQRIWEEIYTILVTLYEREGIEYIDFTGYNFIEKGGKVYIIDFGDARYAATDKGEACNWFLADFLQGEYTWNPDFA